MPLDRRQLLKGALGASGAAVLGSRLTEGLFPRAGASDLTVALPTPASSGIEHVVVVMMENRSFDHFLGWLPGASGKQSGLSFVDPHGVSHKIFHETQLTGCGFNDPDHSYQGGRIQYDGGRMDGFLADSSNDEYAIGYYTAADRPFMSSLALNFTTCDQYFCSILGPTYPNRFFQHSAQTDRLKNDPTTSTLPTIWDQLNQPGGPTGRYYFSDVPFLALWGTKYVPISAPYTRFLADAAAGTLPSVSFVDPRFVDSSSGTSGDDHPRADIRVGDAFLSEVFHALSSGPGWANTVLVVNYDEWGGFYDHVAPSRVTPGVPVGASPTSSVDTDQVNGQVLLGFRVPCIVASPFTLGSPAKPTVAHGLFDHTSVLKLIEWRWGLHPLSQRDASTADSDPGNLATIFNFAGPNAVVPSLPNLTPPVVTPCGTAAGLRTDDTWPGLIASGLLNSWIL